MKGGIKEKKYPKVGNIISRKKNTNAKCGCGLVASFKTEIQQTYMRGDDMVIWSCDTHKNDAGFLLESKFGLGEAIDGALNK